MPVIEISPQAKVTLTLGLVASVLVTVVTCTWKMASTLNEVNSTMRNLDARVSAVESNRFRISDAAEVALRTAIENPKMRVPDPRDPSRIIAVGPHEDSDHKRLSLKENDK